jgi:uncharacterized membrane protein YgdD (TMEM256/DUF423 family)
MRLWLFIGALNGLTGVIAGAYGWHHLETSDPYFREVFMMGSQYQLFHGLALLAVAWLASRTDGLGGKVVILSGISFTLGIVLFSGSLYNLGLFGEVFFHGLAPAGGFLLMLGWVGLIGAAIRK